MLRLLYIILLSGIISCAVSGCIEDGFTSDPNDQPEYSVDTLRFGAVFTAEGTPTHSFKVFNRHDKGIVISRIAFRDPADEAVFRLNVDGVSGRSFDNVEIRANDSIYVLVEATLPENGAMAPVTIDSKLDFTVNGRTSTVVLNAVGCDVERLYGVVVSSPASLSPARPYQIFDSLVVDEGAVLTIPAGVSLHFHSGAELRVRGTLLVDGSPEAPVTFSGDRFGQVVGRIPYDVMSAQWGGIIFYGSSRGNRLSHASVRNTSFGVVVEAPGDDISDEPALTLVNCMMRNSATSILTSVNAPVDAVGCEFADAPQGVVVLSGGVHRFNHCTFSNNYIFASSSGAILDMSGEGIRVDVANSIIHGLGVQVSPSDVADYDVRIRRTLLKSAGTDDANYIDCIWDADPLFRTVRTDYLFDYRLLDASPAIGTADAALTDARTLTDFYGSPRGPEPDLGAYVYTPAE